jgi:hypothetical protein
MTGHHICGFRVEQIEGIDKKIRLKPIVRKEKMAVFASSCLDP